MAAADLSLTTSRAAQRRRNIFNALAAGLVVLGAIVHFVVAPAVGFTTIGARISLVFGVFTLVLGIVCVWDAVLISQEKPTFDVTLPPPLSGLLGGVTAAAVGILIGTTIFT